MTDVEEIIVEFCKFAAAQRKAEQAGKQEFECPLCGGIESIKISKMTTQPIKNCMRIVGVDGGWYAAFQEELKRRGIK